MESNIGTLPLSPHLVGIVYRYLDPHPGLFGSSSLLNDFPAIKSWANPLLLIANDVIETISRTLVFTK